MQKPRVFRIPNKEIRDSYAYWIRRLVYHRIKGLRDTLMLLEEAAQKAITGSCSEFCSLFQDKLVNKFQPFVSTRSGIHVILVFGLLHNLDELKIDYCMEIIPGAEQGNLRFSLTWKHSENVAVFQLRSITNERDLSNFAESDSSLTPPDLGSYVSASVRECRIYFISVWKSKCTINYLSWVRVTSGSWKRSKNYP